MRIEHLADAQQHLEQIAHWQHAEFGYLNPATTVEERRGRLRATTSQRLPVTLVALSHEDSLMGSASIVPTTITHPHLGPWLSSVIVPANLRGRGVASALCLEAIAEAHRLGFETLHLFTPRHESLYQRLGWTTFDRVDLRGVSVAIMSRLTGL